MQLEAEVKCVGTTAEGGSVMQFVIPAPSAEQKPEAEPVKAEAVEQSEKPASYADQMAEKDFAPRSVGEGRKNQIRVYCRRREHEAIWRWAVPGEFTVDWPEVKFSGYDSLSVESQAVLQTVGRLIQEASFFQTVGVAYVEQTDEFKDESRYVFAIADHLLSDALKLLEKGSTASQVE